MSCLQHSESLPKSYTSSTGFLIPSLIGLPSGNSTARVPSLRRRFANSESADLRPASLTSGQIGVVLSIPVMERDCRFTNFWRSVVLPMFLVSSHQSSAPYNATACTATTWIFRTFSGEGQTSLGEI
jgi:hypothetical protein